jgi:predicted  nucleic acid-binding Zn-ribbon protein
MDEQTTDPDSEVQLSELRKRERSLSAKRTQLHNRIDFLRAGGGGFHGQDADLLAELERQEKEISRQRRELHELIDRATAQLGRDAA